MVSRGTIFAFVALLLGRVDAQRGGGNAAAATTTNENQSATQTGNSDNQTQKNAPSITTTPTPKVDTPESQTTGATGSAQSDTPSSAALPNVSSAANNLPQLTSSAPLPSLATGLPALTQNTANIPTYQVVIPQNAGNPFLQTSSFPEGTVFIIVGSCLAGVALMLIASRAIYIWCLHRETKKRRKNVKYSEMEQRPYTATNGNPSTTPFSGGNNISLDYLRPGDRSSRVSTFSSRPSTARPSTARPSTARPQTSSNLRPVSTGANPLSSSSVQFYSPSAHPGGTTAAVLGTQSSRDSAYLPAGYYLREPASNSNNTTATASQMYNTPTTNSTFLYSDPTATPITRLSRTPTANSTSTTGNGRPATANSSGGGRPISGYSIGQQGYSQSRRAPSSHGESETYAGDRRNKPTQFLDDLLGGR